MQKKPKVLFLSRGNVTRGQMAVGFVTVLWLRDRFDATSAGIEPGTLNPIAVEAMLGSRRGYLAAAGKEREGTAERTFCLCDYSYVT